MKLRYYMRGLGIGMLVTAVLMGVTIKGKTEKLTDGEIIERAKELGMEEKYDSTILSQKTTENEPKEQEAVKEEHKQSQPEAETTKKAQTETSKTEVPSQETTTKDVGEEQPPQEGDVLYVQITVHGGDGSMTVSRKLKEAGLIEDILAYDKYLCSNGYDRRICTGTHSIPMGASDEKIAEILTTKVK